MGFKVGDIIVCMKDYENIYGELLFTMGGIVTGKHWETS